MEEEIDLRGYIGVMLRHWKIILSTTLIAVIIGVLLSFLPSRIYEARAAVLITETRYEIVLVPEYKTLSGDEIFAASSAAQRETLIALIKSSTIASQVIEQLGGKLNPEERSVGGITSKVKVENQGNFIEISVKDPDPEKASTIANAWVVLYVGYVNDLYSDVIQSPEEFRAQADAAKEEYEEKEKILDDFIRDNRIDELTRQIYDKELLCQLKSLRQQFEAGTSSSASTTATSLAFILLQTSAFTDLSADSPADSPADLPAELQVSLDELSDTSVSLEDIDALISTLESRSKTVPGQTISELRQGILELQAELAAESAEQQKLSWSRDIAWETYTTLDSKTIEVQLAAQAQDGVVQLAAAAVVPHKAVSTHKTVNIGTALVLGLVAGVIIAFGIEYFRKPVKVRARKK
jgi:succinoglycan biosynthesis transport protein ExoP